MSEFSHSWGWRSCGRTGRYRCRPGCRVPALGDDRGAVWGRCGMPGWISAAIPPSQFWSRVRSRTVMPSACAWARAYGAVIPDDDMGAALGQSRGNWRGPSSRPSTAMVWFRRLGRGSWWFRFTVARGLRPGPWRIFRHERRRKDQRSFSAASPISARISAMIQKRMTICALAPALFSKWWWIGAIRNTRLPGAFEIQDLDDDATAPRPRTGRRRWPARFRAW